jgi:uncharacterized membrane protein required for colicin V production
MTIYDAAMVGVVIAGMAWGVWRGITWQLASIASLVLGYSASRTLSGQLASQFPGEPVVARGLAMMVIYALVSGGVFLAAWVVRTTLRKLQFEAYDRHLGMLLGGVEGALLGMVATLFVVSLAPNSREPIFTSHAGRVVGQVMATLGPVLPEEARNVLAPFWNGTSTGPEAESLAVEPEPRPTLDPAPESAPESEPKPARGRKPAWSAVSGDRARAAGGDRDPASLGDLIEEGEQRIGRAIVDRAEQELQKVGAGDTNGRSPQRR